MLKIKSYYKEKIKDQYSKTEQESIFSRIDNSFIAKNATKSGVMLEYDSGYYFTENFISLYSDVIESEGTVYERTSSGFELDSYRTRLLQLKGQLKHLRESSGERKVLDALSNSDKVCRSFNQMLIKNITNLRKSIESFSYDITKNKTSLSLLEKNKSANNLLTDRIIPFQDFLLEDKKPSERIVKIISDIRDVLDEKGFKEERNLFISLLVITQDKNIEILNAKRKLEEIIQSAESRLEMMQFSSFHLNNLFNEIEKQSDNKVNNKQLWKLPSLEKFNEFDSFLVESNNKSFLPFEDEVSENLNYLSKELFDDIEDAEIIEDELSVEEELLIEKARKRSLRLARINEFNQLLVQFKNHLPNFYKLIKNGEEFDVYSFIYEKLKILSKNDLGDYDVDFNTVSSVSADFINGYKKTTRSVYELGKYKEIEEIGMKYPCLKFYKIDEKGERL